MKKKNVTGIPAFPCSSLPENPSESKLLGLYPQRQEKLWMQRVKIPGGVLTFEQWASLAAICRRYTPSTPICLTTRQALEFHNIAPDIVPALQTELTKTGLSVLGACGDTLRNITVCPGNGLCEGKPDITSIVLAVQNALQNYSGIYTLPRKFKISFSACSKACAQPWINDLGFIADAKNGTVTIKVIGAGSLGARPTTGIVIKKDLPVSDVPALALAAVQLFNKHGNRKFRTRARLRHIREHLGDKEFLQLFDEEFDAIKKNNVIPEPPVSFPEWGYNYISELNVPFAALKPEHLEAITDMMKKNGIIFRLQNHHRISLFALNADMALQALSSNAALCDLASGLDIASCPGSTFCNHALVNTHTVEEALRSKLPEDNKRPIRISGCSNGCAHSTIAEIGLVGRIRKDEEGKKIEGFQVLTGGGMGLTQTLAETHTPFVPSSEIVDFIIRL